MLNLKNFRKISAILLATTILLSLLTFNISGEVITTYKYKDFIYEKVNKTTVTIRNYTGDKQILAIPTKIKNRNVTWVSSLSKAKSLKSLIIPNGVSVHRAIGKCKTLKQLIVLDTNKKYSVENNMLLSKDGTILKGCPGGITPDFPDSVTKISAQSFWGMKFTDITLGKNVKTIYPNAFNSCKKLKTVKFNSKLKYIHSSAFSYCTSLTSIKTPKNLKSIGESAFSYCTSLESIRVSKSVTKINDRAFTGCEKLKNIYITNKNCEIIQGEYGETIPNTATIHAPKGSAAQKYAKKNGNKFKAI